MAALEQFHRRPFLAGSSHSACGSLADISNLLTVMKLLILTCLFDAEADVVAPEAVFI